MEFNALTTNHVKLGQDLEINLDRIYYSRLNTRSTEKKRNINHGRIKTSEMTRCSILISRVVLQGVVNLHIFFITWKRSNSDNLREQEEEDARTRNNDIESSTLARFYVLLIHFLNP